MHSFRRSALEFEALADISPSGPEVVQALRNLAKIWREIADLLKEPEI